jgi:hypothetical protein
VCGGAVAFEQARRAENQRAGANRRDISSPLRLAAEEFESFGIFHHRTDTRPARHEQQIHLRNVSDSRIRDDLESALRRDRLQRLRDHFDFAPRHPGEHFVRAGKIEMRQVREYQHAYDHRNPPCETTSSLFFPARPCPARRSP